MKKKPSKPPARQWLPGINNRIERKRLFIRALAEFLAGNAAQKSIDLELQRPWAIEWAKVRSATTLFGYPSVDEAEMELTAFLG